MKRKLQISLFLVMMLGILLVPQSSFAASGSYRSISWQAEYEGTPLEKINNYYVWRSEKKTKDYKLIETALCCSRDGKEVRTLKCVKAADGEIDSMVSTNGKIIYYGIYDSAEAKCVIYKTTITGKNHKRVKTVKGNFVGYYNNKIYYSKGRDTGYYWVADLYQYDLKTKKAKRLVKDFTVQSMDGRYILGTKRALDVRNSVHHMINLKTGSITKLPKAHKSTTDGKYIYYATYNSEANSFTLKRCSMKGKSVKRLKNFGRGNYVTYLARDSAFIVKNGDSLVEYKY